MHQLSPSAPLAAAGALLLAAVVPGALFFTDSRPFRDIAGEPAHVAHYALVLAGLLALAVAVPRLSSLTSADGRRLPAAVLTVALVATMLTAATNFVQVFVTPFLADVAPSALDGQGGALMVGMIGSWILFLAAWVAVAGVGLRRGVLPRGAALLLGLGALAQPAIGPLAVLPQGLALLMIARATAPAQAPDVVLAV